MLEQFLAVWPQLVTFVTSIVSFIAIINKKLHKIDKIAEDLNDMKEDLSTHIKDDIRYKIKDEWRELKRMKRNGEVISILTLQEAVDLVDQAKKYRVNGETTQMQRDLVTWYNEALQEQYGKDDVQ